MHACLRLRLCLDLCGCMCVSVHVRASVNACVNARMYLAVYPVFTAVVRVVPTRWPCTVSAGLDSAQNYDWDLSVNGESSFLSILAH